MVPLGPSVNHIFFGEVGLREETQYKAERLRPSVLHEDPCSCILGRFIVAWPTIVTPYEEWRTTNRARYTIILIQREKTRDGGGNDWRGGGAGLARDTFETHDPTLLSRLCPI